MAEPSHYEILGIDRSASLKQIRKAYLELVAQYHPDRHQGNPLEDLARERLVKINTAYEVLSNPTRRAEYDAKLGGESFAGDSFRKGPVSGSTSRRTPARKAPTDAPTLMIRLIIGVLILLSLPLLVKLVGPIFRILVRLLRVF